MVTQSQTGKRFRAYLYRDRKGQWRGRIVARNGNKILTLSEGYRRRIDAHRMLDAASVGFGIERVEVQGRR